MVMKYDEQSLNVLDLTKQKLMNLAYGAESLTSKIDNWVSGHNNYQRLRTIVLSRSCLTMQDNYPSLTDKSFHKDCKDNILLDNLITRKPEISLDKAHNNNSHHNINKLSFSNPAYDEEIKDFDAIFPKVKKIKKPSTSNENTEKHIIANPIIRMDGDILEIEYACDKASEVSVNDEEINNNNVIIENNGNVLFQVNSSKVDNYIPKIPSYKIANNKGIISNHNEKHTNVLDNQKDRCVSMFGRKSPVPEEVMTIVKSDDVVQFDKHRSLIQSTQKSSCNKNSSSFNLQRCESSGIDNVNKNEIKLDMKSFLSFSRSNRNNKSDRNIRKKYVVSEEGMAGPIWPAVLLTYDKEISAGSATNSTNDFRML